MKYYHIADSDLILIVNHTEYKCLRIIFNVSDIISKQIILRST